MSSLRSFASSLLDRPAVAYPVCYPLLAGGRLVYGLRGTTPWLSYFAFRKLYGATRGAINHRLTAQLGRPRADLSALPSTLAADGTLDAEAPQALAGLRRDGYYVFRQRLDPQVVERLVALATARPGRLVPSDPPREAVYDPRRPLVPRYQFDEEPLLADRTVQRFLADGALLRLAQDYLASLPINDLFTMWWSPTAGSTPSSAAAQLFHFDMDRPGFVKFFAYLTDVTSTTGPHVYVAGSHRERPPEFYRDRRFSDDEVAAAFGAQRLVEVTGPAGTLVAVDTSGLHKGKVPESGHRLMFQLELASSLFGQRYAQLAVPAGADPGFRDAVERLPGVFRRFRLA
ncbi:MAG TPA: phytanoyl-CoA dioxygenase family protein [Thermoanaerobaculia bacterium]|nr:phytanoyl-CoA dioxygenase family protein [Thermoanaerobaculia bacterium]